MKPADLTGLVLAGLLTSLNGLAAGADTNAAAQGNPANAYRLSPTDKVSYWVDEDPKRVGESPLAVSSLGTIQFPVSWGYSLTIPIETRNKTLDDVKSELKTKLEERYYKSATVHLTLLTQTQRKGVVYFRTMITGTLEIFPGEEKTVTQAILERGGGGDFANLKKVKVTRVDPVTKKTKVYDINVKALLEKPDPAKDLILQDKDIIEVPEKGMVL
jgi:protein involved in polysaccharide export with SLBB domain